MPETFPTIDIASTTPEITDHKLIQVTDVIEFYDQPLSGLCIYKEEKLWWTCTCFEQWDKYLLMRLTEDEISILELYAKSKFPVVWEEKYPWLCYPIGEQIAWCSDNVMNQVPGAWNI